MRNVLVTDFDGTLTRNDFFWLAVETFRPAHLESHWQRYSNGEITHFDALAGIFAGLPISEAQMAEMLSRAELEPTLADCVKRLDAAGWDVVVVSAGCSWYIERILANAGVSLPIYSNPGRFEPGVGLHMIRPTESPFYSHELGIDKAAIVRKYREEGRVVAFAGDGFPDREAAEAVGDGLRWARHDLARALKGRGVGFKSFERWREVAEALF